MSVLLNLPRMLILEFLSEWCEIESVTKLDTAFTNRVARPKLKDVLRDNLLTLTVSRQVCACDSRLSWVVSQQLRFSTLFVNHSGLMFLQEMGDAWIPQKLSN